MKAKKYTEEQIIAVLKEGEAGAKVADLCCKYEMSDATYYNWKAKYAGMIVSELKRLKALEEENQHLKQIVGEHALDEWAYRKGVNLNFIRPGKPIENALAESFIGRLRDECLNTSWFMNLKHARDIIEDWRRDYNEVRPHSSLKGSNPKEYAETAAGL